MTRLTPLDGDDIRTLHDIARRDRRLDRHGRVILAHIARTGALGNPKTLATSIRLNAGAAGVLDRVTRLVEYGYLPPLAGRK